MMNIYYVESIKCPQCLQSGTISVLQVTNEEEVVLETVLIMLRSLILALIKSILYTDIYTLLKYVLY